MGLGSRISRLRRFGVDRTSCRHVVVKGLGGYGAMAHGDSAEVFEKAASPSRDTPI